MGFGSYKTALYKTHHMRAALCDLEFSKLMGTLDFDETYVGGKNKNRLADKRQAGSGFANKLPVIGAVSRKGTPVACALNYVDQSAAEFLVQEALSDKVDLVATDESALYLKLTTNRFKHDPVCYPARKYVRGSTHTEAIDGFWSPLKRGIIVTFQNASTNYLPLHVAEFELRYNNRNNPDIFVAAVARF